MKTLSQKVRQNLEISLIATIILISFILWDTILIFPIKILVVMLHEISHGMAAIISGGEIKQIEVNYNLGGHCITTGGSEFLIASSGYLGSLFWGVMFIHFSYNYNHSRIFYNCVASLLIIITASFISSGFGILVAIGFSAFFIISPRFINVKIHQYLMKFIGFTSCLYVIIDIKEDLLTLNYRITDAQILCDITGIPAILWGLCWFIISLFVVYYLIKLSYKKGLIK